MGMIFDGLFGSTTTWIFTALITALFVVSFVFLFMGEEKKTWVVSRAPALLTTLGLFGTFWGVAAGLYGFDTSDIEASVPILLDGLKTAFWTSILGMTYALTINIIHFFTGMASDGGPTGDVGAEEIYNVLHDVGLSIADLAEGIGGSKDDSLLAHVEDLRKGQLDANSKMQTALGALQQSFETFATKVADNNSQALITALESVMRDFNAKINEQFGDNFKQLNAAVGALLKWQQAYRAQLVELVEHFKTAREGIEATRQGVSQIKDDMDAVPRIMEQVRSLVVTVDEETKRAAEVLSGYAALRTQAADVFPTIQRGMENLTQGFAASVERTTSAAESAAKTMEAATREHSETMADAAERTARTMEAAIQKQREIVVGTIEGAAEAMKVTIESTSKMMGATMENATRTMEAATRKQSEMIMSLARDFNDTTLDLKSSLKAGMDDVQMTFKKAAEEIGETTTKSIKTLDGELESTIQSAMQVMGSKLASLAMKVMEDNATIQETLARLAREARRTRPSRRMAHA